VTQAPETDAQPPEELLWLALRAGTPDRRIQYAEAGLEQGEQELEPDTEVLLLRQLYLAYIELRQLRRASEIAERMASVGALKDIGHHDAARVLYALGEPERAIEAQRLASRNAPAERRSFQLWSLATLQHHTGDVDGALATLRRALRYSQKDRPLIRAHAAHIKLEEGLAVRGLNKTVNDLSASKCREGYGQYLLGMIHYRMGDAERAAVHLRAFLNRNASLDEAKALTLREELRRARLTLAEIKSQ
jgi:tetratricopeptide (TPR) repeat protein